MKITNNRRFEAKSNITEKSNDFSACSFFYPALRQGLYQLLKQLNKKTVYLPYYCPQGIIDPFIKTDYDISYYDVDCNGNFLPDFNSISTDIFVYIHYFGLYNSNNIEIIKRIIPPNTLFVEDFAHTVYSKDLKLTGDYCTFSFTKMIGVSEGSCILIHNDAKLSTPYHQKIKKIDIRLKTSLYLHLVKQSYIGNRYLSRLFDMGLFACGLYDYYSLLMKSYMRNYPQIGQFSMNIIKRVDFKRIEEKRKKIAEIYYENLNSDLQLNLPKQAFFQQALFAYPILVSSREQFVQELSDRGVGALCLNARWWFGKSQQNELSLHHVLLPINHNLEENDIYKVIDIVNEIYKHNIVQYRLKK